MTAGGGKRTLGSAVAATLSAGILAVAVSGCSTASPLTPEETATQFVMSSASGGTSGLLCTGANVLPGIVPETSSVEIVTTREVTDQELGDVVVLLTAQGDGGTIHEASLGLEDNGGTYCVLWGSPRLLN